MAEARVAPALLAAACLAAFLALVHIVFQAEFADGLLQNYVRLPAPLG